MGALREKMQVEIAEQIEKALYQLDVINARASTDERLVLLVPRVGARYARVGTVARIESSGDLRDRVHAAAARFRAGMTEAGFDLLPGSHPIVPVMGLSSCSSAPLQWLSTRSA